MSMRAKWNAITGDGDETNGFWALAFLYSVGLHNSMFDAKQLLHQSCK